MNNVVPITHTQDERPPTRLEIINCLCRCRFGVRRNRRYQKRFQVEIAKYKQQLQALDTTRFGAHMASNLSNHIELLEHRLQMLQAGEESMLDGIEAAMVLYDQLEPDQHEIAQLLAISHIRYAAFLESERGGRHGHSLMGAAGLGAETFSERENWSRPARHKPLNEVFSRAMIKAIRNSPEFSRKANEFIDSLVGHLPKYREVTKPDGSVCLERMPPKLELVKS